MSYDEREAAEILRRAAEMQERGADASANPRLSLDELKRIAAEAGIAPELVERAAQQPTTRPLGTSSMISRSSMLDGEVTSEQFEDVVALLRKDFGMVGVASRLGRGFEWRGKRDLNTVHVNMSPRDGRTSVTLALRREGVVVTWITGVIFMIIALVAIPLAMAESDMLLLGLALLVPILIMLGLTTRKLASSFGARGEGKLEEVMAKIGEIALPAASTAPPTTIQAGTDEIHLRH